MRNEFNELKANKTQALTTLPPDRKVVGCIWVFKLKENVDGSIQKHKVRLVAKGFHQEQGLDYTETFSSMVKPTTIRVILTIDITYKWNIQQIYVNNSFLNGNLHDEVNITKPPSFVY